LHFSSSPSSDCTSDRAAVAAANAGIAAVVAGQRRPVLVVVVVAIAFAIAVVVVVVFV
jgi:hypothetical protein